MLRRRSLMGGGPKDYIEFTNADIGAYFAERYGDGVGITYEQAAAITEFDSDLQMANIVGQTSYTFEELNYFTGLVSLPLDFCMSYGGAKGYDCNISRLSLPNLTTMGAACFLFANIDEIDCPKLSYLGYQALVETNTKRIVFGDAFTEHTINGMLSYQYCLEYLYFANLQKISNYTVIGNSRSSTNLKIYIATPSGPPTFTQEPSQTSRGKDYFIVASTAKLYVPSNLISAYQADGAPWTTCFASINAI
jgi:hypothetical protein